MATISLHAPALAPEECKKWACMDFWSIHEAVLLSIGYDPDPFKSADLPQQEAEQLWREFDSRVQILDRSRFGPAEEQLPFRSVPSREGSDFDHETVFSPQIFVDWARLHLPSFPDDLSKAVKDHSRHASSDKAPRTIKQEVASNQSVLASELANKRWQPLREMSAKAEDYAAEQLRQGCLCSHAALADVMFHAVDEQGELIFHDDKIKDRQMEAVVLRAAKIVLKEHAPERVLGSDSYSKAERPCPLHKK